MLYYHGRVKYNHDNLTVVCVAGEAGNTLKLFDQIILINNKQPRQAFPLKPVRHEITIIRNGKKIKKNITPTKNRFNELTIAPIEKDLINKKILNKTEIKWINSYHKKVKKNLFKFMSHNEKNDLINACSPI